MFLGFLLCIALGANIWLGWMMASWAGIGAVLIGVPVTILLLIGGGLALGLIGMVFGKHDDRTKGQRFLRSFLRGWAWLVLILWLLPWISFAGVKLMNDYAPATLPRITITNGDKTVIFQSMMHVASPEFYDEVRNDMTNLQSHDFVFFYEGVRKGTDESVEKLSQLVGTDVSPEMYDTIAKIANLTFQGDEIYDKILPSTNVDMSTDDIVGFAQQESINTPAQKEVDAIKFINERYPTLTPFQKNIAQVLARGGMNILLRKYTDPQITESLKKMIPVFGVILDKRNDLVVDAIAASSNRNIYIHYGAMHFAGILEGLQKKDPRWHEMNRVNFVAIR